MPKNQIKLQRRKGGGYPSLQPLVLFSIYIFITKHVTETFLYFEKALFSFESFHTTLYVIQFSSCFLIVFRQQFSKTLSSIISSDLLLHSLVLYHHSIKIQETIILEKKEHLSYNIINNHKNVNKKKISKKANLLPILIEFNFRFVLRFFQCFNPIGFWIELQQNEIEIVLNLHFHVNAGLEKNDLI